MLGVATLRQRLFSKTADLPEGVQRLSLKSVHLTKSPMVISRPTKATPDVDDDLYGGCVNSTDRGRLNQLRALSPAELAHARIGFDDDRLDELVFRCSARNLAGTLSSEDPER